MIICFTGDLFLGGDLINSNLEKNILLESFNKADKRIVNLEQAISDNDVVAEKGTLFTDSSAISTLTKLKIDAVNLANNHIQDKGLNGITETIEHLENEGINYFGAGRNLKEAKDPYWINERVALFGYCDFGQPYLKQVQVAEENQPGVNPLRLDSILSDLDLLEPNQKTILYFHWGREHVWFPPRKDIELSKKLLEDERVITIIGMHAHRSQGFIEHNGKRAVMCLGNFLFPNFYIEPHTQITYPERDSFRNKIKITRRYHRVFDLTYKKWKRINRISMVLNFNITDNSFDHEYVIQSDDYPIVKSLNGFSFFIVKMREMALTYFYKFPPKVYNIIERLNTSIFYTFWKLNIKFFWISQIGIKKSIYRLFNKLN